MSDTVFDKPRNNWEAAEQVLNPSRQQASIVKSTVTRTGAPQQNTTRESAAKLSTGQTTTKSIGQHNVTSPIAKKDLSQILASRPKAVVKKKETPAANKPYIVKSLEGLTKGHLRWKPTVWAMRQGIG